jgi:hypothetical protein
MVLIVHAHKDGHASTYQLGTITPRQAGDTSKAVIALSPWRARTAGGIARSDLKLMRRYDVVVAAVATLHARAP